MVKLKNDNQIELMKINLNKTDKKYFKTEPIKVF